MVKVLALNFGKNELNFDYKVSNINFDCYSNLNQAEMDIPINFSLLLQI